MDIRLPVFERVWDGGETKWKHVIEPYVDYRFVNGVNDFGRFLRFDEDETLTDTNEIEYGITQRLYRRKGSDDAEEFITWHLSQKYFFDPTFGGALVPGQPNVFQTLDALTPFAFADVARRFSPIVSDHHRRAGQAVRHAVHRELRSAAQPADGHRHAAEAEALQGVVSHPRALFHAESSAESRAAAAEFRAALESGARARSATAT